MPYLNCLKGPYTAMFVAKTLGEDDRRTEDPHGDHGPTDHSFAQHRTEPRLLYAAVQGIIGTMVAKRRCSLGCQSPAVATAVCP
jgi:hypothetical protein